MTNCKSSNLPKASRRALTGAQAEADFFLAVEIRRGPRFIFVSLAHGKGEGYRPTSTVIHATKTGRRSGAHI